MITNLELVKRAAFVSHRPFLSFLSLFFLSLFSLFLFFSLSFLSLFIFFLSSS